MRTIAVKNERRGGSQEEQTVVVNECLGSRSQKPSTVCLDTVIDQSDSAKNLQFQKKDSKPPFYGFHRAQTFPGVGGRARGPANMTKEGSTSSSTVSLETVFGEIKPGPARHEKSGGGQDQEDAKFRTSLEDFDARIPGPVRSYSVPSYEPPSVLRNPARKEAFLDHERVFQHAADLARPEAERTKAPLQYNAKCNANLWRILCIMSMAGGNMADECMSRTFDKGALQMQ